MNADNRLYRSSTNGMIAGVCAGVADYFGLNLTAIRVVTVVCAFFFPSVILIYLLLAVLLKKRPTPAADDRESELRRRVRSEPHATLSAVRHRFRELDLRLQRLERYVTSNRFELDRELRNLQD